MVRELCHVLHFATDVMSICFEKVPEIITIIVSNKEDEWDEKPVEMYVVTLKDGTSSPELR